MNHNVGDKVKIICDHSGHDMTIGTVVTIQAIRNIEGMDCYETQSPYLPDCVCFFDDSECESAGKTKEDLYREHFGDIIFPEEGEARRNVYERPSKYMYSEDGIHWAACPMDLGKIAYSSVMYRLIPDGVTIGVSTAVKQNPDGYEWSADNGFSWHKILGESDKTWMLHGQHDCMWFQKV
jgi:hypothetical protein